MLTGVMASVDEEAQAQQPAESNQQTSTSNRTSHDKVAADVTRIPEAETPPTNKMRFLMTPSRKVFESRLQKELKQNYPSADYDLDGYTVLQERLERLNLLEHEQRGDGNCQVAYVPTDHTQHNFLTMSL